MSLAAENYFLHFIIMLYKAPDLSSFKKTWIKNEYYLTFRYICSTMTWLMLIVFTHSCYNKISDIFSTLCCLGSSRWLWKARRWCSICNWSHGKFFQSNRLLLFMLFTNSYSVLGNHLYGLGDSRSSFRRATMFGR